MDFSGSPRLFFSWHFEKETHTCLDVKCPVNQTLSGLKEAIESGQLSNPRSRRIAEEILDLLTDVAWGRAGGDHLGAIASLADELSYDKASAGALAASKAVWDALGEHREVFQSHIDTHNCATGACDTRMGSTNSYRATLRVKGYIRKRPSA